jgi:YidC/Oxa1 family membrane protein insertase
MFTTFIVQPLFNLLVLIYAILPGHNFGLALIIFTLIIRILLWPLVKKQLHQARAMRKLQPELKRIKQASKGDRQKESKLLMELYKEQGINPIGTLPILVVQFIILIGLYSGLRRVIANPHNLISFAYPAMRHLSWMRVLAGNIHRFDNTFFGIVNLSRSAAAIGHGIYWPAMIIVLGSAVAQFFQASQLMPATKDQRGLRAILKDAGEGKPADQSEVNAAVGRSTRFLLPVMIFLFTVRLASALSLYWLAGGVVAYIQQSLVLRKDETEMEVLADKPGKNPANIPEAEVVPTIKAKSTKTPPKPKKPGKKKRR